MTVSCEANSKDFKGNAWLEYLETGKNVPLAVSRKSKERERKIFVSPNQQQGLKYGSKATEIRLPVDGPEGSPASRSKGGSR